LKGIALISDLHLIEHYERVGDGVPFFKSVRTRPDEEVVAFLEMAKAKADLLIINGDFVDFDLIAHQGEEDSASESLARLDTAYEHHRPIFDALRAFLKAGGAVAMVVGNHDLDWFRPEVRTRLVELIWGEPVGDADERFFRAPRGLDILEAALPRIFFYPHRFELDGLLWAEHGHLFDPYARWPNVSDPQLGGDRLYYPVGSLVNRYVTLSMWSFNPFVKKQVLGGLASYLAHYVKYHLIPPWSAPVRGFLGIVRVLAESMQEARLWRNTSKELDPTNEFYPPPAALDSPFDLLRTLWLDRFAVGTLSVLVALIFAVSPLLGAIKRAALVLASLCLLPLYELLMGTPAKGRKLEPYIDRVKGAARRKKVKFFVFSHTHEPLKVELAGTTLLNPGCFAPMCTDVECNELLPNARCGLLLERQDGDWTPRFFRVTGSSLEEFEPIG